MTRQSKTPRQRVEEALGVAERRVKKLAAEKAKLAHELDQVTADHDLAVVRRDYLARHPDLQTPTPSQGTSTKTDTSTGDKA